MWRNLDARKTADGLVVSLDWSPETDELQVITIDWASETTVRCLRGFPRERARDVFNHPNGWGTPMEGDRR